MEAKSYQFKSNNVISLIFILFFWLIFFMLYLLELDLNLGDFTWSFLFVGVVASIYLLRIINKINLISLYSLFFLTSLMFIGGRFISIFLGYDLDKLFELNFFINKRLTSYESSRLFYIVILGFLSLELGLYFYRIFFKTQSELEVHNLLYARKLTLRNNSIILYFVLIVIFLGLSEKLYDAYQAVVSGGYLALFESQSDAYGFSFSALLKIILLASTGVFLCQENKKVRTTFLIFMGIYFIFDAILGGRGGFVCYLIFLVWYLYDCGLRKAPISKFILYISSLILFLSLIFSLISFREASGDENISVYQKILSLLYDQGVTLMVFNESMYIQNYPIIPFIQNFIPGTSFIYTLFFGPLYPYDVSFAAFISYTLSPEFFNLGFGLGWAFFADIYQYSFGNILFFCFFIFLFSIFLNYLQNNITTNIYIKIITISLVSSILFLPRSGLNSVFPLVAYIVVFYLIIQILSRLMKK